MKKKQRFYSYFGYLCNELGGGRRRLDSDVTDDGLSGFPKEQQTHSGDGI